MFSSTKIACARCVQSRKSCSFNPPPSMSVGSSKRKTRIDSEDEDDESSRTSHATSQSVANESEVVVVRSAKRAKLEGKSAESLAQAEEEETGEELEEEPEEDSEHGEASVHGEDSELEEQMKTAYGVLGVAKGKLLRVQLRANRAMYRAEEGGTYTS